MIIMEDRGVVGRELREQGRGKEGGQEGGRGGDRGRNHGAGI